MQRRALPAVINPILTPSAIVSWGWKVGAKRILWAGGRGCECITADNVFLRFGLQGP